MPSNSSEHSIKSIHELAMVGFSNTGQLPRIRLLKNLANGKVALTCSGGDCEDGMRATIFRMPSNAGADKR